jgi:hypothetical protein
MTWWNMEKGFETPFFTEALGRASAVKGDAIPFSVTASAV